jgi:23S rRNA pseudouridine1911/1915/1917 synthase
MHAGKPEILFEDNHLLAIVKPIGMPSQADSTQDLDVLTWLKQDLIARLNKPGNAFLGLVHRLDRPVGGAMLFAKTSKAASRLSHSIREHQFRKVYLAVIQGQLEQSSGELKNYLHKSETDNKVIVYDLPTANAKEAILRYQVQGTQQGLSLVEVELITGRSHQIRAQFAHIGHPLFGDSKYGSKQHGDIALWSARIEVKHPTKDELVVITSSPAAVAPWSCFELGAID